MIWNRKKPYLAEITFSKLLSGKHSNKEIIHYEISLGDSGIYYEPGDSLAVVPNNDNNLALAIINRLKINSSIIPAGQHSTFFELLVSDYEILTPTNRLIYFINERIKHSDLNNALRSDNKSLLKELSVKNIQWMRFEIENFGVPKFSQYALLNQNINTVSNDIINGKNILIHCMAGLGRTGMIAALILIKLGIDINQSIKLIRNIRPGSIETEEQEKFVRNFKLI